jgi:hypothetical protein
MDFESCLQTLRALENSDKSLDWLPKVLAQKGGF